MIGTTFESRVKVHQIIQNQLPEFILDESPKAVDFLKQYFISQEYQGGSTDIVENLDQYLKLDNLTPEIVGGTVTLAESIGSNNTTIIVNSTKGFPNTYGILQIDDEIITYKEKTETSFLGCVRGFSGITNYHKELEYEELVFSESSSASHTSGSSIKNLSVLFLLEFYKKLKYTFSPGLEELNFVSDLNVGNFIKHAKTFYQSKGTEESFRILFNVLFGVNPKIVDLEKFVIKSSGANYIRREILIVENISGNPSLLLGQTIRSEKDPSISGSVSEIEIITRNNKTYYKFLLFVGYDDVNETTFSTFVITPNTKCIDEITPGETTITVDSTLGFLDSGILYVGGDILYYTSKSINQFFGCHSANSNSITISIPKGSSIISDFTYYGYENGDTSEKVIFRITGVLSNLKILSQDYSLLENDIVSVKHLGDRIDYPDNINDLTYKQINAHSWIYNTSSKYQISTFGSSYVITRSPINRSSLKIGDYVEIISKITNLPVSGLDNARVVSIEDNKITIDKNLSSLDPLRLYDIRRKITKSYSEIIPISTDGVENLNNKIFSNIQNLYSDSDGEFNYVASNSLPSYNIESNVFEYEVSSISNYNQITQKYSEIEFDQNISFLTGDEIYYTYSDTPITGLEEGKYYVELLTTKKIRLYTSRNFIDISSYIEFGDLTSGTHKFTLLSQVSKFISPQKILRKFKLNPNVSNATGNTTLPGSVGMLINGVEIFNYKSNDRIYYGPLSKVSTLNPGKDYDVVNPPKLLVSGGAKIQPIVQGSISEVYIDPQEFDIEVKVSIAVTGGNGSKSILKPVILKNRREILFDARTSGKGGGVDITNERITFLTDHNLITGQEIIYDNNGNSNIGISSFKYPNTDQRKYLVDESSYYARVLNSTSIQLHTDFGDSILGVNTVGFTTIGTSGIQKFKTQIRNTLSEIKVYDGGEGFTNRELKVNPSGISTYKSTIGFVNHGFSSGELVKYNYQISPIVGLSSSNQYYVVKIDDDSFRLCDAGIGATIKENYVKNNYVKFTNTGSGYQTFNYPDIKVTVTYTSIGIGTTTTRGEIIATPVVKGGIIDTYVYENGSDYGSKVLNFHKKPTIKVEQPNSAQIKPIISDGKIIKTLILYSGAKYTSTPDITVVGDGTGAKLRGIISPNGKLTSVIIINSGYGYSENKTSIVVNYPGRNVIFNPVVRSLSLNQGYKYGIQQAFSRDPSSEILHKSTGIGLQYSVSSYSEKLKNYFNETGINHSPIIGWGYDGVPIYGPYGYSDPFNKNSQVKLITSGYGSTTVVNRPSGFEEGFFKEDYAFIGTGDLDVHNGRYCITPEFPNGTYAYFATSELNILGELSGKFPYFIGNTFKSNFISENITLNQSVFDLNNSGLFRNTSPYNVSDPYAGNDFIIESNELVKQTAEIESITHGEVTGIRIIDSGDNYKVEDKIIFDESDSGGFGVNAQVSELIGRDIVEINTQRIKYESSVITRKNNKKLQIHINPYHELDSGDNVIISGITTDLFTLNGQYKIGFTTYTSYITKYMPPPATTGIVTFMTLPDVPEYISIGSSVKIENEVVEVLGKFDIQNTLKIKRVGSGVSHLSGTPIYFLPNYFEIDKETEPFNSKNSVKVYFNPRNDLGIGTTAGGGNNRNYWVDGVKYQTFTPTQSIFVPQHPFKTGQKVILRKPSGTSGLTITDESGTTSVLLLSLSETAYVINKSKDYIGIATNRETSITGNGVFFPGPTGTNNEFYTIETSESQITGDVNNLECTLTTSTPHLLKRNDQIELTVKPSLSVGIGTTTAIKLKYNSTTKSILVHKTLIETVNASTNTIGITSHLFNTGDLVYYDSEDSVASGLNTGTYYVCKIDHNNIRLSENYYDCFLDSPKTVSIDSSGGNLQQLWFVNPKLNFINNNNITFDATDPSLYGYDFNLYYDNQFNNKLMIDFENPTPILSGIGTVGTTAILTINHSDYIPQKFYYNFESNSTPLDVDEDVRNFCEIEFGNSVYNGKYNVHGIGSTTFNISLNADPERLKYSSLDCDVLRYTTTSISAKGPISKTKIISGGSNYKKLPIYKSVSSVSGDGAYILPKSNTIGKLNRFRIINEGFEYSSDKTLVPFAEIPKVISLRDSRKVSYVDVIFGGKYYLTPPDLVLVNKTTGKKIDSGLLVAKLNGNSIISVEIQKTPVGIPFETPIVRSVNNTNGIKIDTIQTSVTGVGTMFLSTPIVGFYTNPFATGDYIFVEGVTNHDPGIGNTIGLGFNSSDHGYQFFKVTNYVTNSNPGKLEFEIPSLYGYPGVAKTTQDSFASVINKSKLPTFEVQTDQSVFLVEEQIYSSKNGQPFEKRNLYVSYSDGNSIRLTGDYKLSVGEIIKGSYSFLLGTVQEIESFNGLFDVSFSKTENVGWLNDAGKISEDTQVLQDNDYYQNLSYTIKSTKEWSEMITPVNNLVHPSGLKNFSDTQIQRSAQTGIATSGNSQLEIIRDVIEVADVTTINNIDLVYDIEPLIDSTSTIKFQNIKLADYVECRTNRVLAIDDISPLFSSIEDEKKLLYTIISPLSILKRLNKALIQIKEIGGNEIQISEVVVINDSDESFTLQRGFVSNRYSSIGEVTGFIDDFNTFFLKFDPVDTFNTDYEIKILKTEFNTSFTGVSTYTIGLNRLISSNKLVDPGITTSIVSFESEKFDSFYTSVHFYDITNNEANYVELFVNHDNQNTYLNEFYFDSDDSTFGNYIGSFGASLSNGIISLDFTNIDDRHKYRYSSKTVGFGSTAIGIGTYRFKYSGQPEGLEQTAVYASEYVRSSSNVDVVVVDSRRISSLKSTVRVSYGQTSALHQVLLVSDGIDVSVTQYPFVSIGATSGIGTFGGSISGFDLKLTFYPDTTETNGANFEIKSFSEEFYKEFDEINVPPKLTYGQITESHNIAKYFGTNSERKDRLNFTLNYNGTPIFQKEFDPSDSDVLDRETHIFNIPNHFFSTGEKLYYRPKSTYVGVGTVAVSIGATENYLGITTDILPEVVYPIKIDNDQFRLATKKEYASAGIYVTFTSYGEGNAHQLEMAKKNEKAFITVANLTQYPLSWTQNYQTLQDNGGSIGVGNTIFALSGISSVIIRDIIKIDDEYMKIVNVGFGTTSVGPITFSGDVPLVEVTRGFCGTASSSHTDGSIGRIYKGSYNISGKEIFFTDPPRGNITDLVGLNESNLIRERAKFSGRVFLRKNYDKNTVYDSISSEFTGIGQTYTLTTLGVNTVGLGTTAGNGLVFINSIFQTPTTENPTLANYQIVEDINAGITSVVFSGITSSNGQQIVSDYDQNQNQLPRGGLIVSLGSTPGLGYAPLVGAKVITRVDGSGTIQNIVGVNTIGSTLSISTAYYDHNVGVLQVTTVEDHKFGETGISVATDSVFLEGLEFSCSSEHAGITSTIFPYDGSSPYGFIFPVIGVSSEKTFTIRVGTSTIPHTYVGHGTAYPYHYDLTFGSGYRGPISVAVTESGHTGDVATITASVGAGGTLSFNIVDGGSGYTNPQIVVPTPSYENMPIIGVSRLGVGDTTECGTGLLVNLEIGPSGSSVGIGTTLFEVSSFKITRSGFNFREGDIFTVPGLVTDRSLNQPVEEFKITVLETFSDSFGAIQLGEMNYIDSIRNIQDGNRRRFPLYYNSELLSFESNPDDPDSSLIDFDSLLVIFINGILQEPKKNYNFSGGTTFTFTTAPKKDDNVSIFFYVGTRDEDSIRVSVSQFIEEGDVVQINSNNNLLNTTVTQNKRTVSLIAGSDRLETNIYRDQGIDEFNPKPLYWTKKKKDVVINDEVIPKSRDSLEAQVYPTSKVIKNFNTNDTSIFLDNTEFFDYEEGLPIDPFDCLIINDQDVRIAAALTAIVSTGGTISSLDIVSPGEGYSGASVQVKISAPKRIGVGIGTTATATIGITDGKLNNVVTITNPGFGYTRTNPPNVIAPLPQGSTELIKNVSVAQGFEGHITGIAVTDGLNGATKAIEFTIVRDPAVYTDLEIGYPIYINNTRVGSGVTSIEYNENDKIAIGTVFLDNIYHIHGINKTLGIITCNVASNTSVVGIATTGTTSYPVGSFSWGRLAGFSRSSSPISIAVTGKTLDVGLTTFSSAQRRGTGLRNIGALKKRVKGL